MPNLFTEQIPLHVMCAPRDKNIRNYIGPQCLTVNKKQRSKSNTNQHTHTCAQKQTAIMCKPMITKGF